VIDQWELKGFAGFTIGRVSRRSASKGDLRITRRILEAVYYHRTGPSSSKKSPVGPTITQS
jgi:hypothetical protein